MGSQQVTGMPLPHVDEQGMPIPVTIPVPLGTASHVVFTTRLGGISQGEYAALNFGGHAGDDPRAVLAHRQTLQSVLAVKLSLVAQVHGNSVFDADSITCVNAPYGHDATGFIDQAYRVEADAQVSTMRSHALGMFAADCLPVLLADDEAGVIGAAHCGRRGLMQGVIDKTVEAMCAKGAQASRMTAILGPCICGDCYEVGEEIARDFERRYPQTLTRTRFGGVGIYLAEAARIDLALAGVGDIVSAESRVRAATQYLQEDSELEAICRNDGEGPALAQRLEAITNPMCTLENPLWYSHRRASLAGKAREGRLLALIIRDK